MAQVSPYISLPTKDFSNDFLRSTVRSDLFQHRLWLGEPGKWQDVLVPFQDFTLTNSGTLSDSQIEMMREKVSTMIIML